MPEHKRPVQIDARLIHRIGVREWGLPTLRMPGQTWRSEEHGTVSCMLPAEDPKLLCIDTRPLETVPAGHDQWMPDAWRAAMWEYVQAWPSSGHGLGPFLAITEAERCDFIRSIARDLVDSDNIGCLSIAHGIGQLAAYEYETVTPEASGNTP